jgi:hypothetical protein
MNIESWADSHDSTFELGRGRHGVVDYDRRSNLVRKRLLVSEDGDAGIFAEREFGHLQRLSKALMPHPNVSCPTPVRIDREHAEFWMTHCPGVRLDKFLASSGDVASHLDHIGSQIALALRIYIEELNEPWFSLSSHNMNYEPESGIVSVFDFTKPRSFDAIDSRTYAYEISLGCYLAATTRYTVSPARLTKREFWNRQRQLSIAIIEHVLADRTLDRTVVKQVNVSEFRRLGLKDKRLTRRAWYSTVGHTVFQQRSMGILARALP